VLRMDKIHEYPLKADNCRQAKLSASPHLHDAYEILARRWERPSTERMTRSKRETEDRLSPCR
jgi:hypothetical protein